MNPYSTSEYQLAGFFSSGSIGFLHFQDLIMAILLGFFGALGAWCFQRIVNKIKKGKDQ
jgi:H+/Cl- antiporter ClcA